MQESMQHPEKAMRRPHYLHFTVAEYDVRCIQHFTRSQWGGEKRKLTVVIPTAGAPGAIRNSKRRSKTANPTMASNSAN